MPFQPLLPKTSTDFRGGDKPGTWIDGTVNLFRDLGDTLEFDAGINTEINSVPSPWSRPLQFISAFKNANYPSRDWLIAQYRGLLATLALAENLRLDITVSSVQLPDLQDNQFAKCIWGLRPRDEDSVLSINPDQGAWSEIFLFELDGVVIGMTSPATLICPTGYFPHQIKSRISWLKWETVYNQKYGRNDELGFFQDPIQSGLAANHKNILSPWLADLRNAVLNNPINADLSGNVARILDEFIDQLNVRGDGRYQPCEQPTPFGMPLGHKFTALHPAAAVIQDSHVKVIPSRGRNDELYIIDPRNLPGILGIPIRDINVIGSAPLENFDPNLHRGGNERFATPRDFFLDELYYSETPGLLPGSWLDQTVRTAKIDNLTILLPFHSWVQDYFSSEDLERNVSIRLIDSGHPRKISISLTMQLSGVERRVPYTVRQDFDLIPENRLSDDYPTIALWPNLPSNGAVQWTEFFLLESVSDQVGVSYSFQIQQPTDDGILTNRLIGQESYHYWKSNQRPDILEAQKDGRLIGMIPLKTPQLAPGAIDTWAVGVDFGTSFTSIYMRKGNQNPEPFQLNPALLKVTLGSEVESKEFHDHIYRDFFIPDVLEPLGNVPPMSTAITTLGWQEPVNGVAQCMTEARIYYPNLSFGKFSQSVKTNIKWENIRYQKPFLSFLVRLISAQAAMENVQTIEWSISYPSAFSRAELNQYRVTWQNVLNDIKGITGQTHTLKPLQTESIAFSKYFADILGQNMVHTTCIDVGGGTSDLSIWRNNELIHQASVPFAGRDMFHNLLRSKLDYFPDIFGGDPSEYRDLREITERGNFNSFLDLKLRFESETNDNRGSGYKGGYRLNCRTPRNRQFRSLLAFAYCGLFHYIGLVQKWLKQEGKITENYSTSLLIGGNGSRFIHWLSPTGQFTPDSEINQLVRGIIQAATDLTPTPNLITLSNEPKQEACGGLVVPPDGERLKGIDTPLNDPYLGEACVINGQSFAAHERLSLRPDWDEITEFSVTSTIQLETYLRTFNQVITDGNITEIEQIRDTRSGKIFELNDELKTTLSNKLTASCLRKQGERDRFEKDPPFLMVLKSFLEVLVSQW